MDTRRCSRCKTEQNIDAFLVVRGYRVSPCRECRTKLAGIWRKKHQVRLAAKRVVWYAKHKGEQKKRVSVRVSQSYVRLQSYKVERGCPCGERHPACLDFHHRDPKSKEFYITIAAKRGWAWSRIAAEVEKCDVLCSNCHRKLHWNEKHGGS